MNAIRSRSQSARALLVVLLFIVVTCLRSLRLLLSIVGEGSDSVY